jgi:hypothetical protein
MVIQYRKHVVGGWQMAIGKRVQDSKFSELIEKIQ